MDYLLGQSDNWKFSIINILYGCFALQYTAKIHRFYLRLGYIVSTIINNSQKRFD